MSEKQDDKKSADDNKKKLEEIKNSIEPQKVQANEKDKRDNRDNRR